jgi:hypothetical protein
MRSTNSMVVISALVAALFVMPAVAQAGGAGSGVGDVSSTRREENRARIQQKVKTYLTLELSSRLNLDDKRSLQLASAVQAHMERRRISREQARAEMDKLRSLIDKKAPDAQVKAQLDAVVKEQDRGEDLRALLADTGKFLSVQEQAKLALAAPEVLKGMRQMMREARREGRGGRHGERPRGDRDADLD